VVGVIHSTQASVLYFYHIVIACIDREESRRGDEHLRAHANVSFGYFRQLTFG
jgi:hypothetical protein